jgi:uncharacterized protein (TIGR02680 family)
VSRLRPTRAGVLNLWDYRDEEFVFADGRLVLRGPNGSGKTKALEVLFPFVLDGRIEPRRLNPFASEDRTMKSNLLYRGQDVAHAYVWLEFAREAADDPAEAVTVGVGLRAQRHSDRVTRWYFVVDGRVGVDFSLIGPDDRPLTRKQLAAEIGTAAITDRAANHRAAIDARLFGLGAERYEQLMTLVLTLRRPQLAKHLDPKSLSQTLTDGLQPLDDELIAEAARSFDDMESVQRTLDGLIRADAAATAFLSTYTTYLRTHARAAADVLARRLAAVEESRTTLARWLTDLQAARELHQEAAGRGENATAENELAGAHLASLQASQAYQSKAELDKLVELVDRLSAAAAKLRDSASRAADTVRRRSGTVEKAREALADADHSATRAAAALAEAATDSGIGWDVADAADDPEFAVRVTARTETRRADIAAIRSALSRLDLARGHRDSQQRHYDAAERALAAAEERQEVAEQQAAAARTTVAEALTRWTNRHQSILDDLGTSEAPTLLPAALDRVDEPDAPSLGQAFERAVGDAVHARRDQLGGLRRSKADAEAELAKLRERRDEVAAERDDAPPAFHARTAVRDARAGAPLWRLVRFADGVPAVRAAAVEAALEAANLLDAWVCPDDDQTAEALRAAGSDGYLLPLPEARRPSGPSLVDLLVPEPDARVPEERVTDLLRSIAVAELGDGVPAVPTVSAEAGTFALGIQLGIHHKPEAEYIGATARQRRRTARLAELDQTIADQSATLDRLDAEITSTTDLLAAVAAAERALPATGPVITALRRLADAISESRVRRSAASHAHAELDQAIAAVGEEERQLHRVAAERSAPSEPERLRQLATAVDRFEDAGRSLSEARGQLRSARDQLADREEELDEAAEESDLLNSDAHEAERSHAEQAEALRTLRDAVGADVAQVLEDIDQARRRIAAAKLEADKAEEQLRDAIGEAATAEQAATGARRALQSAINEAQADAHRLAPYAHREILDLLRVPSGPAWPAAAADWKDAAPLADLARRELDADPDASVAALPAAVTEVHHAILAVTGDLRPTDASLKSSKTRISGALGELQAQLSAAGHDYRPEWQSDDDVIVVRVADDQGFAPVGEFARRIGAARRDQELLLTDAERRILEDALLGRLAQQIHDRTIDARDLIAKMATEMRTRRMSSGTAVGVRWELADALEEEQRAVSRLLDRDASGLGPDDLSRLRGYFARQIKITRSLRPDRTYAELLSDVLDYRRWRTFVFYLIDSDGSQERLTQSRHSTLSGGEQSVSLHLPLFAAAHVSLSSAEPSCPRLLALDEAFAGVDGNGRRELLGLTAQFDLDLFMTGYDLWAHYDTVPACAHYELTHSKSDHTVSTILMVWDGKETIVDSRADLAAALGSPGTRRRPDTFAVGLLDEDSDDEPEVDE